MGYWGHGIVDNDYALDAINDLDKINGLYEDIDTKLFAKILNWKTLSACSVCLMNAVEDDSNDGAMLYRHDDCSEFLGVIHWLISYGFPIPYHVCQLFDDIINYCINSIDEFDSPTSRKKALLTFKSRFGDYIKTSSNIDYNY